MDLAAINDEIAARDPCRPVGGQERNRFGDVGCIAFSAERDRDPTGLRAVGAHPVDDRSSNGIGTRSSAGHRHITVDCLTFSEPGICPTRPGICRGSRPRSNTAAAVTRSPKP